MFRLAIEDESGDRTIVPIAREAISIGRRAGCTIRLAERNVSRNHAKLRVIEDGFELQDSSRYGTWLNEARINNAVIIDYGDCIRIGDYRLTLMPETRSVAEEDVADSAVGPTSLAPDQQAHFAPLDDNGRPIALTQSPATIPNPIKEGVLTLLYAPEGWAMESSGAAVYLNGNSASKTTLSWGDLIIWGGARYRFSPGPPPQLERPPPKTGNILSTLGVGLLCLMSVVGLFTFFSGPEQEPGAPQELTKVAQGTDAQALTNSARQAIAEERWSDAQRSAEQAIRQGSRTLDLRRLRALAIVENSHGARLQQAKLALDANRPDVALTKLAGFPGSSVYYARAMRLLGKAEQALSNAHHQGGTAPAKMLVAAHAAPATTAKPLTPTAKTAPPAPTAATSSPAAAPPSVTPIRPTRTPATPSPRTSPLAKPPPTRKPAASTPKKLAPKRRAPDEARELFTAGRKALARSNDKEALELLQQAARADHALPDPHLLLGILHQRHQRQSQAKASFKRFLKLASPKDPRRQRVEKMLSSIP